MPEHPVSMRPTSDSQQTTIKQPANSRWGIGDGQPTSQSPIPDCPPNSIGGRPVGQPSAAPPLAVDPISFPTPFREGVSQPTAHCPPPPIGGRPTSQSPSLPPPVSLALICTGDGVGQARVASQPNHVSSSLQARYEPIRGQALWDPTPAGILTQFMFCRRDKCIIFILVFNI